MKKYLLPVLVASLSILISGCSLLPAKSTIGAGETTMAEEEPEKIEEKSISLDEIAEHKDPQNCWLAIDGNVYDVSSFTDAHPGGEAILKGCGKDASMIFKGQLKHQEKAVEKLATMKIGSLK